MTDYQIALLLILNWINGILLGYIIWAPLTPFKSGMLKVFTFGLYKKNEQKNS